VNPILIKSYTAAAAILASRIVKFGSNDYEVLAAVDGAESVEGITVQNIDSVLGDTVDVIKSGIAQLKIGGTITRGDWIVADGLGVGVAANITPGSELHVIGKAEESGVDGDVIDVWVQPVVIATDTGIIQQDVTIATEDVLALNATPQELVAAPGVGKALVLVDAQLFLDYATTDYDGVAAGEDLAIKYTDAAGDVLATIETTGFLDASADAYRHIYPAATAAQAPVANAALVAHLLSGEIATGDSPLKVRTRYRVVDVAW
jgi:hypothetical protein